MFLNATNICLLNLQGPGDHFTNIVNSSYC